MTIQIHTLWGARKGFESDAPELMVAWDEHAVVDNPDGFTRACQAERDAWGSDLVAERFIMIDVPRDKILGAFQPPTIAAQAPEATAILLSRIGQRLTAGRNGITTSQAEDLRVLSEVYNALKGEPLEPASTPVEVPTLGSMAEQMDAWRAAGVTKASLDYAVGQVWGE